MTCLYKDLQYSRNGMTRWKDKLKTLIRHYPNDVDTSAQLNLFG